MFEKKKKEEELEDTKVAEEVTPGGIEVPKEEGAKEVADLPTPEKEEDQCETSEPEGIEVPREESAKPCTEDPSAFTACITLESELIDSKSAQEVIAVLDEKLQAIREAAIKRIAEIKN